MLAWASFLWHLGLANQLALSIYGPYKKQGQHTSYSNEVFDSNLRAQSSTLGVRDMEEVISVAETNGFYIHQIEPMPANNYSLVFYSKREQDTTYDVFDFCWIVLYWLRMDTKTITKCFHRIAVGPFQR